MPYSIVCDFCGKTLNSTDMRYQGYSPTEQHSVYCCSGCSSKINTLIRAGEYDKLVEERHRDVNRMKAKPPKKEPIVDYSAYISPIKEFAQQVEVQRIEDLIVQVSQKVGYIIDKEQLILALNYDRNQFKQGFIAGKQSAENIIKEAIIKLQEVIDEHKGSEKTGE